MGVHYEDLDLMNLKALESDEEMELEELDSDDEELEELEEDLEKGKETLQDLQAAEFDL